MVNIHPVKLALILVIQFLAYSLIGQTDNQSWSSVRFRSNIDEKTRIDLRPIVRHINDFSTYQNSSIDIVLRRKFGKGWYGQFLARHWFEPNAPNRQFVWGDLGYVYKNSNISFTNRLRLHVALDLNDITQGDFIRYQSSLTPTVSWKAKPFFAIEPWYQLNGLNKLSRIRYETGLNIPFLKDYNFTFMYRRQDSLNRDPSSSQNQFVMTLTYTL